MSSMIGKQSLRACVLLHQVRYRNFRTMTTPDPVQFSSVAVDPAGEVRSA